MIGNLEWCFTSYSKSLFAIFTVSPFTEFELVFEVTTFFVLQLIIVVITNRNIINCFMIVKIKNHADKRGFVILFSK